MERSKRWVPRWLPVVGLCAIWIVSLAGALVWGDYLDEGAYLVFGDARDLAAGRGWGADRSLLSPLPSPLYVLVLWLPAWAGMSLLGVGLILSALGWGATGVALYDGGRVLRRPVIGGASAALLILSPMAVSTLGTDVPWGVAWACIAVVALLRRRWVLQAAALALMLGTRFHLGTLAIAFLMWTAHWGKRRRFPLLLTLGLALVLAGWGGAAWTHLSGSWLGHRLTPPSKRPDNPQNTLLRHYRKRSVSFDETHQRDPTPPIWGYCRALYA